jgi:pectate lyase
MLVAAVIGISRAQTSLDQEEAFGWASQNGGTKGGKGGPVDTVASLSTLNAGLKAAGSHIFYLNGSFTGDVVLGSDKTLIGFPGSSIKGSIIGKGVKNVIIRNLTVSLPPCGTNYDSCKAGADAVHFEGSSNVWADHLDVSDGQDGNFDITHVCDYFTISWVKFYYTYPNPHNRSNLFGSDDSLAPDIGHYKTTFQYNWWWKGIGSRMPRTRYGDVHIVNNLTTSTEADYCITVGGYARVLIEDNVFIGVKDPIVLDPGGTGLERNNLYQNTTGSKTATSGAFTPPYTLTITPVAQVESKVRAGAGATLKWSTTGLRLDDGSVQASPKALGSYLSITPPSAGRITVSLYGAAGRLLATHSMVALAPGPVRLLLDPSETTGALIYRASQGEKVFARGAFIPTPR